MSNWNPTAGFLRQDHEWGAASSHYPLSLAPGGDAGCNKAPDRRQFLGNSAVGKVIVKQFVDLSNN